MPEPIVVGSAILAGGKLLESLFGGKGGELTDAQRERLVRLQELLGRNEVATSREQLAQSAQRLGGEEATGAFPIARAIESAPLRERALQFFTNFAEGGAPGRPQFRDIFNPQINRGGQFSSGLPNLQSIAGKFDPSKQMVNGDLLNQLLARFGFGPNAQPRGTPPPVPTTDGPTRPPSGGGGPPTGGGGGRFPEALDPFGLRNPDENDRGRFV